MSDYFDNVKLYLKHFPDPGPDPTHPRPDTVEQGAGILQVGVNVNGVEIPLVDVKASDYVQRIEDAQKTSSPTPEQQTTGQPGTAYETPQ